jgi:hypothetical protein
MGNVSFSDRFELFDLLRDEEVQTFRARERATGRSVEAHLSASPELLAKLESGGVIDRGSHEGKLYIVTASQGLDSVGAWRIKSQEKAPPGDFTRMFELRQAPEPVAAPAARAVETPAPSQPGEFTRVFKKPAAAPASTEPAGPATPGDQGEFTRMFQKPVAAPPVPASPIPASPIPASEGLAPASAPKGRAPVGLIVTAILIISAIAVFVLWRTLY